MSVVTTLKFKSFLPHSHPPTPSLNSPPPPAAHTYTCTTRPHTNRDVPVPLDEELQATCGEREMRVRVAAFDEAQFVALMLDSSHPAVKELVKSGLLNMALFTLDGTPQPAVEADASAASSKIICCVFALPHLLLPVLATLANGRKFYNSKGRWVLVVQADRLQSHRVTVTDLACHVVCALSLAVTCAHLQPAICCSSDTCHAHVPPVEPHNPLLHACLS